LSFFWCFFFASTSCCWIFFSKCAIRFSILRERGEGRGGREREGEQPGERAWPE
jgi:hypothetical protein